MKSLFLTVLGILLSISVFAQTAIGVYVSPDINQNSSYFGFESGKRVSSFGVTLGLIAQTGLSERFSVLYGIQYAPKHFTSNGYIASMTVSGVGTLTDMTSFESREQHIEVPLQIRYGILGRNSRLIPYVQAGVVGTWLANVKDTYTTENGETFETEPNLSGVRTNLSPEVGVGVAYRVNEQVELNIQPTLRSEFDSPILISRIGLGTTLFYKF